MSAPVGVGLWLWYGIRAGALPLILANLVTLGLAVTILFLKWRYGCDIVSTPAAPPGGAPEPRE
jgi:MtN3 and saliva related transmembrane protein